MNSTTFMKSHQMFNNSTLRGAKADKLVEKSVCPLLFLPVIP